MFTFSEEALQIALDNNLTIMGTSDVHVLIDWDFNNERESFHRPITFIISENKTIKSTRDALFNQKTFVWFHDLIIGKEENLKMVANENFSIKSYGYDFDRYNSKQILKLEFINHSVAPLKLRYTGEFNFHSEFNFFEIKPKSKIEVYLKTLKVLENVELPFEILNYVVAPKTNLSITKNIFVK